MPFRHVVVDGSNLATEGRSTPSLQQLDEAVRAFQREFPGLESVTVVVDASFPNRIDKEELVRFEEARAHGEVVSPPAGAIGRGDAFLLRIAEKSKATVLSNDSFQEFHGEHEWLFDKDRLIGGMPVPGVGWIFTPRTPVRGPRRRSPLLCAPGQPGGPSAPQRATGAAEGGGADLRGAGPRPSAARYRAGPAAVRPCVRGADSRDRRGGDRPGRRGVRPAPWDRSGEESGQGGQGTGEEGPALGQEAGGGARQEEGARQEGCPGQEEG